MKNYIIIIACLFVTSCSVVYSRFSEALFNVAKDLLIDSQGSGGEKEQECEDKSEVKVEVKVVDELPKHKK